MRGWVGVAYTTGVGETDREGFLVFKDYPVIESVEPNSPAQLAGLEAGDTILAMNAQDMKSAPLPIASMIQPRKRIVFRYKRGGVIRETTVTVVPRPQGSQQTLVITMLNSRAPGERASAATMRRDRAEIEVATRSRLPVPVLPPMSVGFSRSLAIAGAELTALNDGLRSLIGLASGPGLFVVNVAAGTPAGESGLRAGDVILRAARTRLGDPGDLIKLLSEAQKSQIQLQIYREKKQQALVLKW
jgi:serine protease Do